MYDKISCIVGRSHKKAAKKYFLINKSPDGRTMQTCESKSIVTNLNDKTKKLNLMFWKIYGESLLWS